MSTQTETNVFVVSQDADLRVYFSDSEYAYAFEGVGHASRGSEV